MKQFLQVFTALAFTTNVIAQCSVSNFSVNNVAVTVNYTCPDLGIHCTASDNSAQGDAWIKFGAGNNGQLKKPFVFVEGLDLDITSESTHRHGQRGWPNFISGVTDDKDPTEKVFEKAPILINELLARGYDVIYLDHSNGGDYMQNNARVFVDLIKQINSLKVGNEQIIVAGASMGGQTTKYGICLMENENYKHCIADYISIDSPHKGANIPLGFQALLQNYKFLTEVPKLAEVYNGLNLPASRQLLLSHIEATLPNQPHDYRAAWLNDLNAVGTYPKHCRKVALTSGNIFGAELFPEGSQLMDLSAKTLVANCTGEFDILRLQVWAQPGATLAHHIFYGKRPQGTDLAMIAGNATACQSACLACAALPSIYYQYNYGGVDPNSLHLDNCPGGKRNTAKQFVDLLKSKIENSGYASLINSVVHDLTYNQEFHGFVPTISGLDMNTNDLFANAQNFIGTNIAPAPIKYPFDAYYGETSENKFHVEITGDVANGNIKWLLDEAAKIHTPIANPLTSASLNNGVYNYARFENKLLSSLQINNGGKLLVNANLLSEYGINTPMPYFDFKQVAISGSTYTLETCYCDNVLVEVGNNGEFIIGDNNTPINNKALVLFHEGSTLRVKNGGKLTIRKGSKLVMEKNTSLILEQGGQVIVEDGAEIIMQQNAQFTASGLITLNTNAKLTQEPLSSLTLNSTSKLIVNDNAKVLVNTTYTNNIANDNAVLTYNQGAEIQLKGNNAVLELNGKLVIGNNANFTFTYPGANSGYIYFNRGDGVYWDNWAPNNAHITCGSNAAFKLTGQSKTDKVMVINQNIVAMPKNISQFIINKGLVEFTSYNASIESDNLVAFTNTTFKGVVSGALNQKGRGVTMFGQSIFVANNCDFLNLRTGLVGALFYGNNRLANVNNCLFKECGIGLQTWGAGITLLNNTFLNNGWAIANEGLEYNSFLSNNTITAPAYSIYSNHNIEGGSMGVFTTGNNGTYDFSKNTINNVNTAITALNNDVKLRCNDLTNNEYVLYSSINSKINMSTLLDGGFNDASNSTKFVEFDEANFFEANQGFNSFKINDQSPCYTYISPAPLHPTSLVCPLIGDGSLNNYTNYNTTSQKYELVAENNFWRPLYSGHTTIEPENFKIIKAPVSFPTQTADLIAANPLANTALVSCPNNGNNGGNGPYQRVHPLYPNSGSTSINTASFSNKQLRDALVLSMSKMDNMKHVNKLNNAADLLTEILKYNYPTPILNQTDKYLLEITYQKLFSCVAQLTELYSDSLGANSLPSSLISRYSDLHTIINLRMSRKDVSEKDFKEVIDLIKLDDALVYGLTRQRTKAISIINNIIANNPKSEHVKLFEHWRCIYSIEEDAVNHGISSEDALFKLADCNKNIVTPFKTVNSSVARLANTNVSNEISYAKNNAIAVYPNPTQGGLTIAYDLKEYNTIIFEIYDVQGKILYTHVINPEEHQFSIDNLNLDNGVYLYTIKADNENILTKKLIFME